MGLLGRSLLNSPTSKPSRILPPRLGVSRPVSSSVGLAGCRGASSRNLPSYRWLRCEAFEDGFSVLSGEEANSISVECSRFSCGFTNDLGAIVRSRLLGLALRAGALSVLTEACSADFFESFRVVKIGYKFM